MPISIRFLIFLEMKSVKSKIKIFKLNYIKNLNQNIPFFENSKLNNIYFFNGLLSWVSGESEKEN